MAAARRASQNTPFAVSSMRNAARGTHCRAARAREERRTALSISVLPHLQDGQLDSAAIRQDDLRVLRVPVGRGALGGLGGGAHADGGVGTPAAAMIAPCEKTQLQLGCVVVYDCC